MSKHTNPVQKVWIFFENRKVLKLFRFSYKIGKTANSKTAITSNNIWIRRLKFGLRVQNESYSILFTHFFDFKRKWFHMYRANKYTKKTLAGKNLLFKRVNFYLQRSEVQVNFDIFSIVKMSNFNLNLILMSIQTHPQILNP